MTQVSRGDLSPGSSHSMIDCFVTHSAVGLAAVICLLMLTVYNEHCQQLPSHVAWHICKACGCPVQLHAAEPTKTYIFIVPLKA